MRKTIIDFSPRLLPAAQVSTLDINDDIEELVRCADVGYLAMLFPGRDNDFEG